jgi:hypothetical protein
MFNYESTINGVTNSTIRFQVKIKDTTMQFYETYVRQKVRDLLSEFERYFDYAEQFCSYNETDRLFNDFFIKAAKQEFAEPYVWVEAPLYYLLFKNMISALRDDSKSNGDASPSYGSTISERETLKTLDMETIKAAARQLSKDLSPETGDVDSVKAFYNTFHDFYNTYLVKGKGLDKSNEIYLNEESHKVGYDLRYPETQNIFIMTEKSLNTDDIIDELEAVAQSEANAAKADIIDQYGELYYSLIGVNGAVENIDGAGYLTMSGEVGAVYTAVYKPVWDHFKAQLTQETFDNVITAAKYVIDAAKRMRDDTIPEPMEYDSFRAHVDEYIVAIRDAIQNST